jgi:hypothetical protein
MYRAISEAQLDSSVLLMDLGETRYCLRLIEPVSKRGAQSLLHPGTESSLSGMR